MALPANRVPVRVARGLKSALTANLAGLLEGEAVYAKDENKLYVVEGGVLVALGADLAASSIGDLSDVTLTSAAIGEVLRYNGTAWVDAQLDYSDIANTPLLGTAASADSADFATAAQGALADTALQETDSIDSLADVDTTTSAPSSGQVLQFDGTNWVPATPAAGGVTQIIAGTNVTIDPVGGTGAVTINASGGGGTATVAGTVARVTESQTAASGVASYLGLGASGILVQATSDVDAWVVLYPTSALRSADASRAYGTDPAPGSGVLAEFWISAGQTILASPGTFYYNNDSTVSPVVYAAVRDQSGAAVNATVGITGYKHESAGIGGTSRLEETQTASSGIIDFVGIGVSGQFVSVASNIDAWITFYGSAANRTSDSSRTFGTNPTPGDGVQADIFVSGGTTVLMTPALGYFNNDTVYTETIYAAVRDTAGTAANATVTVRAYAQGTI